MKKNVFNSILLATVFLSIFASQQSLADFEILQTEGNRPKHVTVNGVDYLEVTFKEPVGDLRSGEYLALHPLIIDRFDIDMTAYKEINDVTYRFPFPDEVAAEVKLQKFMYNLQLRGRTKAQLTAGEPSSIAGTKLCFPDSIIPGHCSKTHEEQRNTLREVPSITLPEDSSESTTMRLAFDYYDVVTYSRPRHRMQIEYYRRESTSSTPILIGTVGTDLSGGEDQVDIGTAVQGEAGVQKVNYDLGTDYDTDWLIPIPSATLEAMHNHPGDIFTIKVKDMTSMIVITETSVASAGQLGHSTEKYTIESPVQINRTLSITNDLSTTLVADTANSLSANFSRTFVPATARLELRQGTTVIKTENLALEDALPENQVSATYALSIDQVNQLRSYLGATGFEHYLVLEDDDESIEKKVTFTGTPPDLSITNEPAAALVADTANSLSANFSRTFIPATARLELRQGTTVVETENLALEGSLPADQASATYTLSSAQVNQLRIYLGATGLEHYLVLTDTADLSVEKVVTFTGTPPDLSITNEPAAALVADTANSLSANFSRAFVPATARLELRQGTTVVETENLALEGSLPADQRSATYALSGGQVNTLLQYTGVTDFKYYLVLTDTADLSVEKVVTFTGTPPDLSIINEPAATLVADTANSLSANFSRAFVPATARLELRQGTTVVETENLALEGSLPADQTAATYVLSSDQVNQLRTYLNATDLVHYLVLEDSAGDATEKVVTFTGTPADLSITNEPAAALVADTANSLSANFSRTFVPATARLELRQGTTVVETENLALEGSLPADQASATYTLSSAQVNQLRIYLGATGLEHYLVLTDTADLSVEKVVTFTGTPADLSITNEPTAALVADTANSLSANFSRAFVPATAKLELRQGTTVVETENLALEGSLPADQTAATYALSGGQVNTLLQYTGVTDFKYYLVLTDTADLSVEKSSPSPVPQRI